MNRLRKPILLVLIVTILSTAFALIALASEDVEAEKKMAVLNSYNFNSAEVGSLDFEANHDGAGTFMVQNTDGYADQYIEHYVSAGSGNSSYLMGPYQANNRYSYTEYPYFAMNFDIMKISGEAYAGATFEPMSYGNGIIRDETGAAMGSLSNTYIHSTPVNISIFQNFLSQETYEWSHVTIIYHYSDEITAKYIGIYIYVDGVQVYANKQFQKVPTTYDPSLYYYGTFRVNNSGGTNVTNKSGYDNWHLAFFDTNYTLDEVASFTYNEEYEKPFSKTRATVGFNIFDDVNKAVLAAEAGQTVILTSDIKDPVTVNKAAIIDTNAYDDHGNPTGKRYTFEYTGDGRYIPNGNIEEDEDGIIEFLKRNNASVKVYWDECSTCLSECTEHPSEECGCTCGDIVDGHIMYEEGKSALFAVPVYSGDIPVFETTPDGQGKNFLGWTYEKGGEAGALRAVTAEDAERGYIDIYPVYQDVQYNIVMIDSEGNASYYFENEISTAFAMAKAGCTIKLLTDITLTKNIALLQGIVFDLNGYTLTRYGATYKDYAAEGEEGAYTKGESLGTTKVGAAGTVFSIGYGGAPEFTLTSSRPGAEIYSFGVTADRLIKDGEVVSVSNAVTTGNAFMSHDGSILSLNLDTENVTFYLNRIIYSEHGGNKGSTYVIDGGTYVALNGTSNSLFNVLRKGTHEIRNATFIGGCAAHTSSYNEGVIITFENCDFLGSTLAPGGENDKYILNNCRLTANVNARGNLVLGGDTMTVIDLKNSGGVVSDGFFKIGVTESKTYTVSKSKILSFNYADESASLEFEEKEFTFNYQIIDKEKTDYTTVHWDPVCEGDCDCYEDVGGHIMTSESYAIVGMIPEFTGSLPQFEISDSGIGTKFVGWSYTNGGEVEELVAVTEEDLERGYVNIYPVYEVVQYELQVTAPNGSVSYYAIESIADVFKNAASGSVIKLMTDVETDTPTITFNIRNKKLTLDLNGHVLKRVRRYGASYTATYDEASGSYSYGTTAIEGSAVAASPTFFHFTHDNSGITVTSSVEGGQIYNATLQEKVWVDSVTGEVVKKEYYTGYGMLFSTIIVSEINLSNVDVYTGVLVSQTYESTVGVRVNIDNCNLYRVIGTDGSLGWNAAFFYTASTVADKAIFNISNTLIYDSVSTTANNAFSTILVYKEGCTAEMNFVNCDIIGGASSQSIIRNNSSSATITFENCRIHNMKNGSKYGYVISDGALTTEPADDKMTVADGFEQVEVSETLTYTVPVDSRFAVDPETNLPIFNFETKDIEIEFVYEVSAAAD